MKEYRTDLALESISEIQEQYKGFSQKQRGEYFEITEIRITDSETGKAFGKPEGTYITLSGESLSGFSAHYPEMTEEFAQELRKLLPEEGLVFVAGLGNQHITPDALGVQTVDKIIATRHLQKELAQEEEEFLKQLRPVSALAGGVLGQTGIESAELPGDSAFCRNCCRCIGVYRTGTAWQNDSDCRYRNCTGEWCFQSPESPEPGNTGDSGHRHRRADGYQCKIFF